MLERNKQGVGQLFCLIYAVRSLLKILLKLLKERNQNHKEGLSKQLGQMIVKRNWKTVDGSTDGCTLKMRKAPRWKLDNDKFERQAMDFTSEQNTDTISIRILIL